MDFSDKTNEFLQESNRNEQSNARKLLERERLKKFVFTKVFFKIIIL